MSELKRILVTGANSGIGLALAKQLVSDYGCHVYLGSRNAERGAEAVDDVKGSSGKEDVELLTIDVSNDASVQSAAAALSQKLGSDKLYAIVNNAGTGLSHGASASEILDTNTRGPRRVVDSFLPLLDPTHGRIVNVGSGAGPMFFERGMTDKEQKQRYLEPMTEEEIEKEIVVIENMKDDFAAYAGSKALLACYTMSLARDHPKLTVSVITPGMIKTNITKGFGASKEPHEGTVSIRKCLFEELSGSGYFWGSDGLRSPLHCLRNPGDPEYDGEAPVF
mmetsp:Transcript_13102/g.31862  ORF Transcript_13102/g.31862 Transcript_13102/m.31862 type:complete len:279 (+) Transcript_13102:101-937(+)